jgi:hypothetical protein
MPIRERLPSRTKSHLAVIYSCSYCFSVIYSVSATIK